MCIQPPYTSNSWWDTHLGGEPSQVYGIKISAGFIFYSVYKREKVGFSGISHQWEKGNFSLILVKTHRKHDSPQRSDPEKNLDTIEHFLWGAKVWGYVSLKGKGLLNFPCPHRMRFVTIPISQWGNWGSWKIICSVLREQIWDRISQFLNCKCFFIKYSLKFILFSCSKGYNLKQLYHHIF